MKRAVLDFELGNTPTRWIGNLFTNGTVLGQLRGEEAGAVADKSCPQGDVVSPLM